MPTEIESVIDLADDIIKRGDKLGADWVEVRIQDTTFELIQYLNNRLKESTLNRNLGIGIRVMVDGKIGFASTSGFIRNNVYKALEEAIKIARSSKTPIKLAEAKAVTERLKLSGFKHHPRDTPYEDRLEMVKELNKLIYDEFAEHEKKGTAKVETVNIRFGSYYGYMYIKTSDGVDILNEEMLSGAVASAVCRGRDKRGDAYAYLGTSLGLDSLLDWENIRKIGVDVVKYSVEKAYAEKAPSGYYPVITAPDVSGVFAHESFGHMSEGDYGVSGASPLSNREGEEIGSENASIYDSGTPPNNMGFIYRVDSEGIPTKTVALMEKGVFKGFMHNRESAGEAGVESTGNGRAQDYSKPVIVRMRNTYFGPGDWELDEMIRDISEGVIVYDERGGQAELSGTFSFTTSRGYYIKNGEIKHPVRDIVLSGNIFEMLKNVVGATKDIEIPAIPFGGCGKNGQGVYVGLGGPYLYISRLNIGGG